MPCCCTAASEWHNPCRFRILRRFLPCPLRGMQRPAMCAPYKKHAPPSPAAGWSDMWHIIPLPTRKSVPGTLCKPEQPAHAPGVGKPHRSCKAAAVVGLGARTTSRLTTGSICSGITGSLNKKGWRTSRTNRTGAGRIERVSQGSADS